MLSDVEANENHISNAKRKKPKGDKWKMALNGVVAAPKQRKKKKRATKKSSLRIEGKSYVITVEFALS